MSIEYIKIFFLIFLIWPINKYCEEKILYCERFKNLSKFSPSCIAGVVTDLNTKLVNKNSWISFYQFIDPSGKQALYEWEIFMNFIIFLIIYLNAKSTQTSYHNLRISHDYGSHSFILRAEALVYISKLRKISWTFTVICRLVKENLHLTDLSSWFLLPLRPWEHAWRAKSNKSPGCAVLRSLIFASLITLQSVER